MHPAHFFKFCPRCGRAQSEEPAGRAFRCPGCDFLYYFNPAIAVAAFIADADQRVLFIRRAKDPAKGQWAIPGGFIDAGETAEEACRREVREEVNLELTSLEFLCSEPNEYFFHDVTYPVLDLFFVARTPAGHQAAAHDEVASVSWLEPGAVNPAEIAFPSMRAALQRYLVRV
jgi:ADP-ribose pyrophosphatase YjhB (NUDIX family)